MRGHTKWHLAAAYHANGHVQAHRALVQLDRLLGVS